MRQLAFSFFILFLFEGCSGCSKSGRFRNKNKTQKSESSNRDNINGTNIVKITRVNGVYQIPVLVNGTQMFFIFPIVLIKYQLLLVGPLEKNFNVLIIFIKNQI